MHSISRRTFCLTSPMLMLRAQSASTDHAILVDSAQAAKIRAAFQHDDAYRDAATTAAKLADSALHSGPWSVTTHRPENTPAGPNDYYSEGPYWWPDPKNPSGPYIRKDGERNPARFMGNRNDLGNMCTAVLSLGMGAYLIGDSRCGPHASRVLTTWFLDPKTRMNPNLQYGQAVRGHNTGRGTGIIDTVSLIHVAQGVRLLELANALDAKTGDGVRRWFADYAQWMNTSKYGNDEKKSGNNHATWWTAQVSAFASLTRDNSLLSMAWDHYRNYLVPTEIKPDGSCPREEERTNSLGYSTMNLDAFSVICRVAQTHGVNLWTYRTNAGIAVEKSFDYLIPFVQHPDRWRKQQISKYSADGAIFPGLAGVGLHSQTLLSAYRALPRAANPWVQFVDLVVRAS
ncbi:MAG TPA: alginate lyase family protein [Bryobacteraceae bacterium]|nr:alginate lyase family protein [Bryobacteraceae bacterium]